MRYVFAIFFTMDDVLIRTFYHICKFKENSFSKYFGTGTFKICNNYLISVVVVLVIQLGDFLSPYLDLVVIWLCEKCKISPVTF